jgi:hypothetical protein
VRRRALERGIRFGERHPVATGVLMVTAFLVSAGLAVAAIERNWSRVDAPALLVAAGAVTALATLALWLWIWRRDFVAPTWMTLPIWVVPSAAVLVALKPNTVDETVSLLAYGFLAPYLVGCAAVSVAGRIEARRHSRAERRRRGLRALGWMTRQP